MKILHVGNSIYVFPFVIRTATPDGLEMAQILSTLTNSERERFDAYRRSTFRGDAIAKYVAYCLTSTEETIHSRQWKMKMNQNTPSSDLRHSSPLAHRELKHLVAAETYLNRHSNPAQEIQIVVSTLAKAYAQRLIVAARKVATSSNHPQNESIQPEHLKDAYFQRVRIGVDPGFFLQTPQHIKLKGTAGAGRTISLCNGGYGGMITDHCDESSETYAQKLESALTHQEEFDRIHGVETIGNKHASILDLNESVDKNDTKETKDSSTENQL